MTSSEEVEEFAKALVGCVRDEAIAECEMNIRPEVSNPIARRWRALQLSPEAFGVLIPDIVDEVLSTLLRSIDQEELHLKYVSKAGREVDLVEESEGELEGWYYGEWRITFSKKRHLEP